jgi:hypothetical protein
VQELCSEFSFRSWFAVEQLERLFPPTAELFICCDLNDFLWREMVASAKAKFQEDFIMNSKSEFSIDVDRFTVWLPLLGFDLGNDHKRFAIPGMSG